MGSDAEVQAPPAEPAAAASGGSKTGMILAIVVVMVVVIAALAYVFVLKDDGIALEGQWTVSGGEVKNIVVINNITANTSYQNITIPADSTVIDFDDPSTMPGDMIYNDLGDGAFEIENFEMGTTSLGTVTGTYTIDGDTMTLEYSGSGATVDEYDGDYIELELEVEVTFVRA